MSKAIFLCNVIASVGEEALPADELAVTESIDLSKDFSDEDMAALDSIDLSQEVTEEELTDQEEGDIHEQPEDFQNSRGRPEKVLTVGDARRDTVAYRQLLDVIEIFRNNGAEYAGDGSPVRWGGINMIFDNGSYDGWFQTLEITETAVMPFRMEYFFTFMVKRTLYVLASDLSSGGAA